MASFTVQELLDRAKVYVDDDHADQGSWIKPERWLAIFNAEYAILYKRWVRSGLVQPEITLDYLSEPITTFTGVLAVVGVARDNGGSVTMLNQAQAVVGRDAFWRGSSEGTNPSVRWAAYGVGDNLSIELDPEPSDMTSTAPIVGVKATLDFGAVMTGIGLPCETVLRMKETGDADNIIINNLGAVGTPGTFSYVPARDSLSGFDEYGFTWADGLGSAFTNQDFEAAVATNTATSDYGDVELPFEVVTTSSSTTNWYDHVVAITSLDNLAFRFEDGVDAVARSSNYLIRYIPTPTPAASLATSVELPFGADERLVLGMARRAHLKDSGASQLLERLIIEADTELGFSAGGKVNGPRVMRRSQNPHSTPTPGSWPERRFWRFL